MSDFITFGSLVQDVVSSAGTNTDQRHRETRATLYRQRANSEMEETPLTKMVMSNKGDSVKNPKYEWGMEARDDRYTIVTGAYDANTLQVADEIGADEQVAADATVYLKMAEADVKQFVVYEEIQARMHNTEDDTDTDNEGHVHMMVTAKTYNGASSYLTCRMLEADEGNGGVNANVLGRAFNGANAADVTLYATPISPAMPEGSTLPWSRYREATEHYNYCQIFMAGLGLTGTELSNAQRFNESTYNRYWRQLNQKFDTYIERAILWGSRDYIADYPIDMGAGEQEVEMYRTGGLRWALKNLAGGNNVIDIRQTGEFMDYDFTGKEWEEAAYDFFKLLMLKLSKKSGRTKKMFCSDVAKLSIMNLFESMANVQVDAMHRDEWGFEVTRIHGLNCTLELHQHADLSCNTALNRVAFIVEPGKIGWRSKEGRDMTVIRSVKDLKKKTNVENGFGWRDATKEGIFMDGGLIYDDLDGMAMITGLGRDFKAA